MARTEVTTGQWVQFINTFSTQAGFPSQLFGEPSFVAEPPIDWAASPDPTYSGPGTRYRVNPVPNAAAFPVRGISWRDAALFCNWLSNGQSSSQSSLWSGAYDTSTFGVRTVNGFGEFTDQITRSTGANFWIPSYDEWAKAAWFDPNKGGAGVPGYWLYSTRSDSPPVYGPPGTGTANAGYNTPLVPVASYPESQTAWGIFDMAGGGSEWNEWISIYALPFPGAHEARGLVGSYAGDQDPDALARDTAGGVHSSFPNFPGDPYATLRIAASVPCIPTVLPLLCACAGLGVTRRRSLKALAMALVVLGGMLSAAETAKADITVRYFYGPGASSSFDDPPYHGTDSSIPIKNQLTFGMNTYGVLAVQVWSDAPTTENLPLLTFTGGFTVTYTVLLSSPTGGNAANDWAGAVVPSNLVGVTISGAINGNLTGPVTAGQISLSIFGTVQANITQREGGNPMSVQAERVESSTSTRVKITANNGGIGLIGRATAGTTNSLLSADIKADVGKIDRVVWVGDVQGSIDAEDTTIVAENVAGILYNMYAGTIRQVIVTQASGTSGHGALGDPSVAAMPIKFAGRMERVEGVSMNAAIENVQYTSTSHPTVTYPNGVVERLVVSGGDFKGSLRTRYITSAAIPPTSATPPTVSISGKIDADITSETLDVPVVGDTLEASRKISTNRFVVSPISMTFPALGLKGQVVLNSLNTFSPPANAWTRPITVDGITLSTSFSVASSAADVGPYYTRPSSAWGGGAVGLAPFHLYESDCQPTNSFAVPINTRHLTTVTESSFLVEGAIPIKVRSYGPVKPGNDSTGHQRLWQSVVRVEAIDENDSMFPCSAQVMDATQLFRVLGSGEASGAGDDRTIGLACPVTRRPLPGVYRLVLLNVRCKDVVGEPFVEWSDACEATAHGAYYFRVAPDCDHDGVNDYLQIFNDPTIDVNPQDGVIDSCPHLDQIVNACRADFNLDRIISVQDIFDFLRAWFAQCMAPQSPWGSPCFQSADFNQSGTLTVQDIFDFLNAWFAASSMDCSH